MGLAYVWGLLPLLLLLLFCMACGDSLLCSD
jgi:hypothetical protein